jgi:hypothetical protein
VKLMLRLVIGWILTGAAFFAFAGPTFPVAPELWDRPRSGQAIAAQPAIRQAVDAYLAQPGASLLIHHAAGQDASLQAEELRAWLIALGVDTGRVSLRNDLKSGEPLTIEILK